MARILSILLLQFNQLKETHDLFKKLILLTKLKQDYFRKINKYEFISCTRF